MVGVMSSQVPVERSSRMGLLREGAATPPPEVAARVGPDRSGSGPTADLLLLRVAALHQADGSGLRCLECDLTWPCNTRQVLDGEVPWGLYAAGWRGEEIDR